MNQIEPTAIRLTVNRSTTELLRNNGKLGFKEFNSHSQPITNEFEVSFVTLRTFL